MDKNTKMLLGVGAVAVVGYLVYQQMNKNKSFYGETKKPFAGERALGRTSRRPKSCIKTGLYTTYNYNEFGNITGTNFHDCKTGAITSSTLGQASL